MVAGWCRIVHCDSVTPQKMLFLSQSITSRHRDLSITPDAVDADTRREGDEPTHAMTCQRASVLVIAVISICCRCRCNRHARLRVLNQRRGFVCMSMPRGMQVTAVYAWRSNDELQRNHK